MSIFFCFQGMKTISSLVFLATVPGILGQIDMKGKAFSFYRKDSGPIEISPETFETFTAFTLCLKTCTNLTENMLMFKLFDMVNMNKFAMLLDANPSTFTGADLLIFYEDLQMSFHFPNADANKWRSICVAFDSNSGRLLFWLNGKLYQSEDVQKGLTDFVPMSIVIGRSFVGEDHSAVAQITDVNMWSTVLMSHDIERFITNKVTGDVINWRLLNYKTRGVVTIEPSHCSEHSWNL
ncbi:hypothetical protein AB205_0102020 [Aquarana catesbeiana]|uniref:Pentraxin (PTX) domain-containing protein n=2 Tax=Aquarana catesbeiana TaxID=8400 RepID=A0A2G9S988_AQUCT|nr:hypothetical protein AB205_0102020 [Aquarana catesbeiana]